MRKALRDPGLATVGRVDEGTQAVRCQGATDPPSVAVVLLTSGERVRIQAEAALMPGVAKAFSGSSVWMRVGFGCAVDEQLRLEARQAPPNLLVLCSSGNWPAAIDRARGDYAAVPILAVAESTGQAEVLALRAGADGFCGLPIDSELFEARAMALLRRALSKAPSSLQSMALEEASRTLRFGGVGVRLSAGEFAIVKRLYQQPECWVSNGQLWQVLGRDPSGYDASLLRTHALNVRRKLGAQRWLLQSERGKGMMLTTSSTYRALSLTL